MKENVVIVVMQRLKELHLEPEKKVQASTGLHQNRNGGPCGDNILFNYRLFAI